MRFEVTILGSNSAMPAYGRFPTSQVLNVQEHLILIDCGEASQIRIDELHIKKNRINHIFISHLHGDHFFGLIGLIASYNLSCRKEPLEIFGPKGLKEIIEIQLHYSQTPLAFELYFHEVDPSKHQLIYENQVFEVFSIPLVHRIPTSGYLFREKPLSRNIIPEKIEEYQIPYQLIDGIKQGNDLKLPNGQVVSNEELTIPPMAPRAYAFCSDTVYQEELIPIVKGCDLLYHETTFRHDKLEQAIRTMHTTALQAATIAKKAKVGKLITGHYSSRYKDLTPLLEEARSVFPNTELGLEGRTYEVEQRRLEE